MTACPHCGCKIDGKTKPRSAPQLRRFFAMLRAMYQHWPETAAEFQPGLTKLTALSIEAALKAAGAYAFIRPHPDGGLVRVFKARSIAFNQMGQDEFNALNDAVEAAYAQETGLDPEQVLKQTEQAA